MDRIIKSDSILSPDENAYCKCLVTFSGPGNAFVECYKKWGIATGNCPVAYNYEELTNEELKRVARQRYVKIPEPFNKRKLIENIKIKFQIP